jgi:hypothetical protein
MSAEDEEVKPTEGSEPITIRVRDQVRIIVRFIVRVCSYVDCFSFWILLLFAKPFIVGTY